MRRVRIGEQTNADNNWDTENPDENGHIDDEDVCPGCAHTKGQEHAEACDWEECPICHESLSECPHVAEVIGEWSCSSCGQPMFNGDQAFASTTGTMRSDVEGFMPSDEGPWENVVCTDCNDKKRQGPYCPEHGETMPKTAEDGVVTFYTCPLCGHWLYDGDAGTYTHSSNPNAESYIEEMEERGVKLPEVA